MTRPGGRRTWGGAVSLATAAALAGACGAGSSASSTNITPVPTTSAPLSASPTGRFKGEVWADNVSTGRVVAVSNTAFKCFVIHKAPLNPACEKDINPSLTCVSRVVEEPQGWRRPGYDVSTWESATAYTPAQIGVKDGYYTIAWDASARLIWTSDLKADNTLLCKVTVTAG